MAHPPLLVELDDRLLRYDGVSIVHPDNVAMLMCHGLLPSQIQVTEADEQVLQFNTQVDDIDALKVFDKNESFEVDFKWNIPEEYTSIDLDAFVINLFENKLNTLSYSDDELNRASTRIADELDEFKTRGMEMFLKTIIFILDSMRNSNVVWGVGRGSSCASYILFLLDLHKVDCIKFDIPMEEFFHD